MNKSNLTEGSLAKEGSNKVHPYMRNNFQGTPEIRETFERISKRHQIKSY